MRSRHLPEIARAVVVASFAASLSAQDGAGIHSWIEKLASEDIAVRRIAVATLTRRGADAIPHLEALLKDTERFPEPEPEDDVFGMGGRIDTSFF